MSYRIVLRMKGLFPNQLKGLLMHARRSGGDLDHIDHSKTSLNEVIMGASDWADRLRTRIAKASEANLEAEIAACLNRQRPKDARMAETRGLKEPWKFTRRGPLREGILTVHHEWFGGAGAANWDHEKVAAFRAQAIEFLQECFGDTCVYARIDMDEEAPHVHFVLAPWNEKISASRGRQHLHGLEEQIGVARQKVLRGTRQLAFDLRSITAMRETLGLDGHPEFDALIARYPQSGPADGRRIAAPR